jgi:formiminoglutamase
MMGAMAWHLTRPVYDVGDICCKNGDLSDAQDDLATAVNLLLQKNMKPIVLGGGHDIAFGHFCGISTYLDQHKSNSKIGIINFDAHFDLRKVETTGNSGTPFYQISQKCNQENNSFNYLCLGIQQAANTIELFDRATELKVEYCFNNELTHFNFHKQEARIRKFIEKVDHIYLTIDIDVFSSAYAPGVSAVSPVGISPEVFFALLPIIIASGKVISIDIAEFNPIYDIDHHTAKLAARIIEHISRLNIR